MGPNEVVEVEVGGEVDESEWMHGSWTRPSNPQTQKHGSSSWVKAPAVAGIDSLQAVAAALPASERTVVERLYSIVQQPSACSVPSALKKKVTAWFGKPLENDGDVLHRVENQRVTRVTNKFTLETALFNPLRAKRPNATGAHCRASTHGASSSTDADKTDEESSSSSSFSSLTGAHTGGKRVNCDFCSPEEATCADTWGRIENNFFITASNVAKADALHGLLIFKDCHDPLSFLGEESYMRSFLGTFREWVDRTLEQLLSEERPSSVVQSIGRKRARREEEAAASAAAHDIVPVLLWNCGPKAGASQVHGHAQMFVFTEKVGRLGVRARAEKEWQSAYRSDYMESVIRAHAALGLAHRFQGTDIVIMSSLTPSKEKELTIVGKVDHEMGEDHCLKEMGRALHFCLQFLVRKFGVSAFNMAVELPSMAAKHWTHRKRAHSAANQQSAYVIAKVIDRGPPSLPSDFAAAEIFIAPVVSTDPFILHQALTRFAATKGVSLTQWRSSTKSPNAVEVSGA